MFLKPQVHIILRTANGLFLIKDLLIYMSVKKKALVDNAFLKNMGRNNLSLYSCIIK